MSSFDPPPYIQKLSAAINDGAKSAQLGAFAFVLLGLFLLAISFSASDEDLLIGKSISIAQLGGAAVPVALSFGFMPAIFLALHLYALISFDLLMQNLRYFNADLHAMVPLKQDRERCLQLLANTEFIQAQLQPEASIVFRLTYKFILAVFPVSVLLLVQLGSLRLQDPVVNLVHHVAIALDLLILIWFFWHQKPTGDSLLRWLFKRLRFVLPIEILGFNLAWCQVPGSEATTVGPGKEAQSLTHALQQPVDLLLCPHVKLGCRFLSVPGRTLVGKVWDGGALVELRTGAALDDRRRASLEPLVLRNRRLRFADLSRSQLFMADLTEAELQGASLDGAQLQGALLERAAMQGATLRHARLQDASLSHTNLKNTLLERADMRGATLTGAHLQGASLERAQLQGARLDGAQMQGARFRWAQMQGAKLDEAELQGAVLDGAQMQGATFLVTQLQGASLWQTQLQGARFDWAQMKGARLDEAQLQGALIADVEIWRMQAPNAELTDLQIGDLNNTATPPCPDVRLDGTCTNNRTWQSLVEEWVRDIPAGEHQARVRRRLAVFTAPNEPEDSEATLLSWSNHPAPEPAAVARRLGDLACSAAHAPHVARSILGQITNEAPRNLGEHRHSLAARILREDCPGARGLDADERATLAAITAGRR